MDQQEIHRLLDEALRNLPVRDRESIVLYYFEGKSLDDAAKAFGISPAAMRKRLERARGRLRDELSAHVESGLVAAARGRRKMSARALAALPAGASFAKIAPAASVLPSAPLLHLTGTLSTMGGTVMGLNKAAIIGAICAAAIIAGGGLYMTRGTTPPEEPPAEPTDLAQSVSAQEEPPDPTEQPQPQDSEPAELSPTAGTAAVTTALQGASISGTVTASDTGAPIPGAEIYIRGPERRSVFSESDGTYTCGPLQAGEYDLRSNVAEDVVSNRSPHKKVSLSHDEQLTDIDFTFERGTSISGRVTDRAMSGIARAKVSAVSFARGTDYMSKGESDKQGNYLLNGIARNSMYEMIVSAKGYGRLSWGHVHVPGTGEVTGVDFVLDAGAIVSGRVVDTQGHPVPNVRLGMKEEQVHPTLMVAAPLWQADGKGKFEITDVGPGTYVFSVDYGDRMERCENGPIVVAAGERITGIEVVTPFKGRGAIEGSVRDQKGNPVRGVYVSAMGRTGRSEDAETDDLGHYRVEALTDDTVQIRFFHQSYGTVFLDDVSVGTTDADVVMAPRGSISGTVMDAATGDPVREYRITVEVETQRGTYGPGAGETFLSETGEFVVENIELGTATITVLAEGYAPQELSDIPVESGRETSGHEFHLSQGNVLRGLVIATSDSGPVSGAGIYLGLLPRYPWEEQRGLKAVTADDGSFLLRDLAAGEHALWVKHPDFAPTSLGVTVQEDRETLVTVGLGAGGTIAGYVIEDSLAASGAQVVLRGEDEFHRFTSTDADGYYELVKLPPGTYQVSATPAWVKEAGAYAPRHSASVEVEKDCVTEKDFEFRSGTGVIQGYVALNGERVRGGSVTASSFSDPGQTAGTSRVGEAGFYTIDGLPPDSYKVFAYSRDTPADCPLKGTASVQLGDGETALVDIEISRGSESGG